MKLKRRISADDYKLLSETKQELYIEKDGSYVLDLDDVAFEEVKKEKAELKAQLEEFKKAEAEKIAKAEERARKKAEEEYSKAKTDKDVDAIEKSWQEKYSKLETEKAQSDQKYKDYVITAVLSKAVSDISSEISTAPKLIAPHIKARLDVDLSGTDPKLIVLDEQGQRSALTVDELKKSFVDNKEFSSIIKANSASGGATSRNVVVAGGNGEETNKLGALNDHQLASMYVNKFSNE